jgi:DhnA family fructose-bisphosphate aldolase class Ia
MGTIINNYLPDDGKAVMVAMDHGIEGIFKGFEKPGQTLSSVLKGDPDGILVTPNFARNFKDKLTEKPNLSVTLRVDIIATSTLPGVDGEEEIQLLFSDLEECVKVGANAIITLLIYGRKNPQLIEENIRYLAELSKKTHHYGIPLVVEVPFWGKLVPDDKEERGKFLNNACRIAFELGADIIKAPYLSERQAFRELTDNLPIPVLILGGENMENKKDLFEMVKNSIEDGAKGLYFGRNIWQFKEPNKMIEAFKAIVHDEVSVNRAMEIISE